MVEATRLRVVSVYDSALDRKAMDKSGIVYAQTRNPDELHFIEGKQPTWFEIDYLTRAQRRWAEDAPTPKLKWERSFMLGCKKIEHLRTPPPRETLPLFIPSGKLSLQGSGQLTRWSDEELERIPEPYLEDIGALIWHRSFLAHESEISFPVVHLSLPDWAAIGKAQGLSHPADDSGES